MQPPDDRPVPVIFRQETTKAGAAQFTRRAQDVVYLPLRDIPAAMHSHGTAAVILTGNYLPSRDDDGASTRVPLNAGWQLAAIDFDVHDDDLPTAPLDRIRGALGELAETTLVRTPSGGLHAYFWVPPPEAAGEGLVRGTQQQALGTAWEGILSDVDVRCAGGLLFAPGSTFPDEPGHSGDYEIITDEPPRVVSAPEFVAACQQFIPAWEPSGGGRARRVTRADGETHEFRKQQIPAECYKNKSFRLAYSMILTGEIAINAGGGISFLTEEDWEPVPGTEGIDVFTYWKWFWAEVLAAQAGAEPFPTMEAIYALLERAQSGFDRAEAATQIRAQGLEAAAGVRASPAQYYRQYPPLDTDDNRMLARAVVAVGWAKMSGRWALAPEVKDLVDWTLRYTSERDEWYAYDDERGVYQEVHDEIVYARLAREMQRWRRIQKRWIPKRDPNVTLHKVKDLLLKHIHAFHVPEEAWDPYGTINCANCVLDFRHDDGLFADQPRVLPHGPEVFSRIQVPVPYVPERATDPTPAWDRVTARYRQGPAGGPGPIAVLEKYVSNALHGENRGARILFAVGRAATGKSTISYVLGELFGDWAQPVAIDSLNGEFGLTLLSKARIGLQPEMTSGYLKQPAFQKLRKLSGDAGGKLEINIKHKAQFQITNPGMSLIFFGNQVPKANEIADGWARRLELIELDQPVPVADREPTAALHQALDAELPVLFTRWCQAPIHDFDDAAWLAARGFATSVEREQWMLGQWRWWSSSIYRACAELYEEELGGVEAQDRAVELVRAYHLAKNLPLGLSASNLKKEITSTLSELYNAVKETRQADGVRESTYLGVCAIASLPEIERAYPEAFARQERHKHLRRARSGFRQRLTAARDEAAVDAAFVVPADAGEAGGGADDPDPFDPFARSPRPAPAGRTRRGRQGIRPGQRTARARRTGGSDLATLLDQLNSGDEDEGDQ